MLPFYQNQLYPLSSQNPINVTSTDQTKVNLLIENPLCFKLFGTFNRYYTFAFNLFRKRINDPKSSSPRPDKVLNIQKAIGKGAFGIVAHATLCNQPCAVKIFNKLKLIETKHVQRTIYEKDMLNSLVHPNIVPYLVSFKDNSHLYICMKLVQGGELFMHIKRIKQFDERTAKQLSAQIVLAFEYLQILGIAHRDIKPENILLDQNGYLKLIDFGFAKCIRGRTFSLCGTPEYMAPEVIMQRGYGLSVDWWSVGVLIYELNFGTTPFRALDTNQIYENILQEKYKHPEFFSEALIDLIQGLLTVESSRRLGCSVNGAKDIKEHPWFDNINWWDLFSQNIKMRYQPILKHSNDLSNFETTRLNLKESNKEIIHASLFQNF